MNFEEKMTILNKLILEYFINTDEDTAKPKDLMPYLIEKGLYLTDHREGLPLRKDLRKLDGVNRLDLIEALEVVRGNKNRDWIFINPKCRKDTEEYIRKSWECPAFRVNGII